MARIALATVLLLAGVAVGVDDKSWPWDYEWDTIGDQPKGWVVTKTGTGDGSVWKVIEDKTAPKGAKALAQTAESPNAVFNLCVVDGLSLMDVAITVAFKAVEGKTDQGGGVVWRYTDAKNYYIARYNPLEDNVRVYKVVDGKRIQLATKEELKAPAGEWHTLGVSMKGAAITCTLNGKKQLEATDDTFAEAGQVGVWTKADARTYFDDFQAKEPK